MKLKGIHKCMRILYDVPGAGI